jgi:hypothetical protein
MTGTKMPDSPSELMSRAALAKRAGISSTTLRNWATRPDQPLETTVTNSGARMYSWSALLRFCDSHPDLQGVAAVRARGHRSHVAEGAAEGPSETTLRASLREMTTALDSCLEAVSRSAELAKDVAAAHAETIAALRQTIRAYERAAMVSEPAANVRSDT